MTSSDSPGSDQGDSQTPGSGIGISEEILFSYILPLVFSVLLTIFFWLVSQYNFAFYHTTVEFITIAISLAIFLLVWNSRKIIDNHYILYIGVTFVFIAILDFFHTLVYNGVGIFPDGGGTLSTRFWIAARYMQAVTLLAAPLFLTRRVRLDLISFVYIAADILIIASIFIFRVFPDTYIPETGLTPFKIISEYIISFILIAAVVLLYRNRDSFDQDVLNNLIIALLLTILAELAFTEYANFTDIFSLLGHIFRLGSYYFFYRAIIEVGQKKPYALLYRNLNESERKYRTLSDLSPDAILVVQNGVIKYANKAGLRMSGIPEMDDLLGKDLLDFIHPDDRESSVIRATAVLEYHDMAPLRELKVISKGMVIPVEASAGPITWEGEQAMQVVVRDITDRKKSADDLLLKNHLLNHANKDLNRLNKELTATHLQLQQNLVTLSRREQDLSLNEARLKEALSEKEILLSEIHHRVKNNLAAFISLLSLEGSYEDSTVGLALKKDLQNRARSMALIHETLYRTQQFSNVDMDAYLTPLIEQIVTSYSSSQFVGTIVKAQGVALDLARATPVGLIVNELVTNSLKYAFPDKIPCQGDLKDHFTIGILLTKEDGTYILNVYDNGIGFPAGFDPLVTKSLGLKLVTFLARYQLQAHIEVHTERGTGFIFRFQE